SAGSGAQSAEAGRKAGGDQLSFARRQDRQGCAAGRRQARLVPVADEEAGDGQRRRDGSESAVAQREDARRRKDRFSVPGSQFSVVSIYREPRTENWELKWWSKGFGKKS